QYHGRRNLDRGGRWGIIASEYRGGSAALNQQSVRGERTAAERLDQLDVYSPESPGKNRSTNRGSRYRYASRGDDAGNPDRIKRLLRRRIDLGRWGVE